MCGFSKDVKLRLGGRTYNLKACIASGTDETIVSPKLARRLGIGPKGRLAQVALKEGSCARQEHVRIDPGVAAQYGSDMVVGADFLTATGALIRAGPGDVTCGAARKAALKAETGGMKLDMENGSFWCGKRRLKRGSRS